MGNILFKDSVKRRERARKLYSQFKQVQAALEQGFDEAPGAAKQEALTTLTGWGNWQAATAQAKANALYLAVALLYSAMAFLIGEVLKE
jgi:hypothetical protein